ncbi:MAG: alpha-amylase [Lachnospiraceae bacterium]|nr:alpha-amylase [Lachnospiraceae bacterium]
MTLAKEDWKQRYPWYNRAVFYHIYPLGLCGAESKNEGGEVKHRFERLMEYIPHMKELSVTGLYIGPLFESTGHGYETTDYKQVDRRLGDNEDFKQFMSKCHENGIKVVVDGVFNHTGREFFAFRDIREKKSASSYVNWYCGVNFNGDTEFHDGFSYESWHGYRILPRLNLKNPAVCDYLIEVIRYWIKEFEIDGIRLDCADVLDFDFMKRMRAETKTMKEDFWLMGEVIHGDYGRYANDGMLHSVTDYELHKGLYSGHNDHNYFEIAHTVKRLFDPNGGLARGQYLYTFTENHDVDRLASKLANKDHIKDVYLLAYTLPGIPSIYYGGEFGMEGKRINGSDDLIRPQLDLKEMEEEKKDGIYPYLVMLGRWKKEYEALTGGRYEELLLTNRQYAFARISDNQTVIIVVNNDEKDVWAHIRIPQGITCIKDVQTKEQIYVKNQIAQVSLKAAEGRVFLGGCEMKEGKTEKE